MTRRRRHAEPQNRFPAAKRVPKRLAAFRVGISAESRAAVWLIAHGYRILARRWKSPLGEIDIVAARRHTADLRRSEGARNAGRGGRIGYADGKSNASQQAAEMWLAAFSALTDPRYAL